LLNGFLTKGNEINLVSAKSKQLCVGCRDNYYNGQGAAECWSYKTAKVVTRYMLGWWTAPTVPGAFTEVETLRCHSAPGQYAMYEKLPEFAIDPVLLNPKGTIMAKQSFPLARRLSPVYLIQGALYVRHTSAAAMNDPNAIRAVAEGKDGVSRVAWFVAAIEAAPEEDDECDEVELVPEPAGEQQKPKIAEAG
jgi:hypothetical protein